MREIRFRTWDKIKKKMYFLNFEGFTVSYMDDDGEGELFDELQIAFGHKLHDDFTQTGIRNDYELMQYTGLKDKKYHNIYEGDILHDLRYPEQILEVQWHEESAGFTLSLLEPERIKGMHEVCSIDTLQEMELIGNIYENSELIK